MTETAHILANLPPLRNVPINFLEESEAQWEMKEVKAGQFLWTQKSPGDTLALLVSGEMVVVVDQMEVGRVQPGEVAGEASAFTQGARRSAALLAWQDSVVFLIKTEDIQTLRQQENPIYDALLIDAVLSLTRRVRVADQEIARASTGGQDAPEREEVSTLGRLWRSLVPGGPSSPCPPLVPLLNRRAGLKDAPPDVLRVIAKSFTTENVADGGVIFLEGEMGGSVYLVAEGKVDVLRNIRSHKATHLATLSAGDVFGVNTMVLKGHRTASCVAIGPTWLYRMDREGFDAMPQVARRWWLESSLISLAAQVRNANIILQKLRPIRVVFSEDDTTTRIATQSLEEMELEPLSTDEIEIGDFSEHIPDLGTEEMERLSTEEAPMHNDMFVDPDAHMDALVPPEEDTIPTTTEASVPDAPPMAHTAEDQGNG